MIFVHTRNGDRFSCIRVNHNHKERGRNVPCACCRRIVTAAEWARLRGDSETTATERTATDA